MNRHGIKHGVLALNIGLDFSEVLEQADTKYIDDNKRTITWKAGVQIILLTAK